MGEQPIKPYTVMVTGGRYFSDLGTLHSLLFMVADHATFSERGLLIIEGGASGADKIAREWAARAASSGLRYGIQSRTFHADWDRYGLSAGPRRNAEMVAMQPDICIAMPGGHGTDNAVRQCKAAGITVVRNLKELERHYHG